MSCGVGCRRGSDPVLLWCRPVATAPIQPLDWQFPHTPGKALKRKKKKKKKIHLNFKGAYLFIGKSEVLTNVGLTRPQPETAMLVCLSGKAGRMELYNWY